MRKLSVALALVTMFVAGTLTLHAQSYAVRGTIQEFGATIGTRPLAGATVVVSPGGRSAITDANGFYSIGAVPAGTYTLRVTAPGHTPVETRITVNQDLVLNYVMQVETAARHDLSGTVTESGSFGTRPLASATVKVSPGGYTARTDQNGWFSIDNLPAGTYTITASRTGHTSETRMVNLTTTTQITLNLPVTGTTKPDDDDDDDDDRGFSGVIRTSDGRAISGASIRLTPGNYTTTTDGSGRFSLRDVPNGTYMMHIRAAGYPAMNRKLTIGSDRTETVVLGSDDGKQNGKKEKKAKKEKKNNGKGKGRK